MSEQDDFQARVDALKAETDAEIAEDRRRNFTWLGQRRRGQSAWLFSELAIGSMFWILGFAALVGAVAVGLGVGIKTAIAVTVVALIAALAFAAVST